MPPLYLEYNGGRNWLLLRDYVFTSAVAGRTLVVRAGQTTDFSSIPRVFRPLMLPTDYGQAGLLHDWAYRTGKLTRTLADQVFLEVLTRLRCPTWKRQAMYRAVRWFGWAAYQKPEHA